MGNSYPYIYRKDEFGFSEDIILKRIQVNSDKQEEDEENEKNSMGSNHKMQFTM